MRIYTTLSPVLKMAFGIFLFCGSGAYAQKKQLLQADKLVSEKRYAEAILLYDKAYQKNKDRALLLKVADLYFSNENYKQAQPYYASYFRDSLYEYIPQFSNYAKSSMSIGKIPLAVKLYKKMYEVVQDTAAKTIYETFGLFVDSAQFTRSVNLDSNFNCVVIDASASYDTLAAPMFYNWNFDDGKTAEGMRVEHCFAGPGDYSASLNIVDQRTGLVREKDTVIAIHIDKMPVQFTAPKKGKRYFFIDFDAAETYIPGYEILEYVWDMDNGELLQGQKIKCKFNSSRDYLIRLTVIAKDKYSGRKQLFSANRRLEILENYEVPSKKFTDALNEAK